MSESRTKLFCRAAMLAALVLPLSGCLAFSPLRRWARRLERPPTGRVNRLMLLWSDAVLRNGDIPVARGFVCKLYLLGPDSDSPVTADGSVTFYAFPQGSGWQQAAQTRPAKVWRFKASELPGHLRKDPVGWGYHFWLPVGPPDPTELHFALACRFDPKGGQPVLSDFAVVTLPGVSGQQGADSDSAGGTKVRTEVLSATPSLKIPEVAVPPPGGEQPASEPPKQARARQTDREAKATALLAPPMPVQVSVQPRSQQPG